MKIKRLEDKSDIKLGALETGDFFILIGHLELPKAKQNVCQVVDDVKEGAFNRRCFDQLEKYKDKLNLSVARAREKEGRHDVMARMTPVSRPACCSSAGAAFQASSRLLK